MVRALLDAGADVHARAFGRTAPHFAAKAGFVETMRALLEAGADPNERDDEALTPLWRAVQSGACVDREPVVRVLLEFGAAPQVLNPKGIPLSHAVTADTKRPAAEREALVKFLRGHRARTRA